MCELSFWLSFKISRETPPQILKYFAVMEAQYNFFYPDRMRDSPVQDFEHALGLFDLSSEFDVSKLKERCVKRLLQNLSEKKRA